MNVPRKNRSVGRMLSGLPEKTSMDMIFLDIGSVGLLTARMAATSASAAAQHIVCNVITPVSEHFTMRDRLLCKISYLY